MKIHYCIAVLFALFSIVGCSGPNYYLDEGKSPDWLRQTTSKIGGANIEMLGTAPITTQVKTDYELAVREAKNQIAQLFMSQVISRTNDWSLVLSKENGGQDRQVLQQNIEIRTNVKVDDVRVLRKWRDEETHTQYVLVRVDRGAWAQKISRRTEQTFKQLENAFARAKNNIEANRPMQGYKFLLKAYEHGRLLEPDIVVLELLDPRKGAKSKLNQIHETLRTLSQTLRDEVGFSIQIECPDSTIASDAQANLKSFLNQYGFTTAQRPRMIRIAGEIGQRFIKKEKIANRIELVHAAQGSLRVLEADGSEVQALSFVLPPNGYTEQNKNKRQAKKAALQLGGDTIVSKFRSLFRKAFPTNES
tara:strand:+ start:96 stop:1181 length:1086 start_codon:yes stop_codon:yes gene_type:complete